MPQLPPCDPHSSRHLGAPGIDWFAIHPVLRCATKAMTSERKNSVVAPQTLRFRLRDKTDAIHRRLDANLNALGMMRDRDGYRLSLRRFLGLFRPLEQHLSRIAWEGSGIDFSLRRKVHWLQYDLERLGLPPEDPAQIPDCRTVPNLSSIPEGLGALYVVEGATLGGQLISRQILSDLDIDATNGGRFFAAYGNDTGRLWREFVSVLDCYQPGTAAADAIERTAISTFHCFESWMAAPHLTETEMT
jgi:heme oxygenase (biliverdin-IX-beta and delta-forming)